jgi:hypothetical protein
MSSFRIGKLKKVFRSELFLYNITLSARFPDKSELQLTIPLIRQRGSGAQGRQLQADMPGHRIQTIPRHLLPQLWLLSLLAHVAGCVKLCLCLVESVAQVGTFQFPINNFFLRLKAPDMSDTSSI